MPIDFKEKDQHVAIRLFIISNLSYNKYSLNESMKKEGNLYENKTEFNGFGWKHTPF